MSKMFAHEGKAVKTWNPVPGCEHDCIYCYARDLAEGRLRNTPKYQEGFTPRLAPEALKSRFHSGLIFVNDMGDLWGRWVPREWILQVLQVVRESPGATFLFLTKNPLRYHDFLDKIPYNCILGTTLESNRCYMPISQAPPPWEREGAMEGLPRRKMVAIEPIIIFDLNSFVEMIRRIKPEFVYVGYDNHNHHLDEPSLAQTRELIAALRMFTEVREKTLREGNTVKLKEGE